MDKDTKQRMVFVEKYLETIDQWFNGLENPTLSISHIFKKYYAIMCIVTNINSFMTYKHGERRPSPEQERMNEGENAIKDFIEKNNLTSRQLDSAYQIALGVPEDDEDIAPVLSEDVKALAEIVEEQISSGLPLNRVSDLLADYSESETMVTNFNKWITEIDISDNERKLLNSIIDQKRIGMVTLIDKRTGDDLVVYQIPAEAKEGSSPAAWVWNIMTSMKSAMAKASDGKIAIQFEAT